MNKQAKLQNGMLSRQLKSEIKKAFKRTKFDLKFGDGWLNIARPDGLHCEFYTCGVDENSCYMIATYTIKGVETEIDIYVPDDIETFVDYVENILK